LDGGAAALLGSYETVIIAGLNPGAHRLDIGGVAGNCVLIDGTSRSIALVEGDTTDVLLSVTCQAPPSAAALRIATVTTGDPDLNGYTYALDGGAPTPIGSNTIVIVDGLVPGTHQLVIGDVADNCTLEGGPTHSVLLTSDAITNVQLTFTCQGTPPTVVATAPLSGAPYGVAVSEAGVIYAAQIGGSTLARGDLTTKTFTSSVIVGPTPPHVVFNPAGTKAYVTLQTGQGLAVVDVATNTLTTTVPLASDGFNLIVRPDGQRVYVTTAAGALYVIDAGTNSVVTTFDVGAAANGLAFSPDGTVLYVSSRDAGTVVAIDPTTNAITRTYSIGGMPQRLAVAPDGSELYVANEISGLDVVNVASGAVTSTSFGTAGYGVGLTPDGAQLFVLLPQAGEVRVLDRASRAEIKTLLIGGTPRNVTFASDGTALITNEQAVVFIH
jgi:YVTN family beta-propeller protein